MHALLTPAYDGRDAYAAPSSHVYAQRHTVIICFRAKLAEPRRMRLFRSPATRCWSTALVMTPFLLPNDGHTEGITATATALSFLIRCKLVHKDWSLVEFTVHVSYSEA